jgi:crossover junction endodeoxyribonuclease RusA
MASGGSLSIELGWPARELSPNVPVHYMRRSRFKKAAKIEAGWATKLALQSDRDWEPTADSIKVHFVAHPPKHWSTGDKDNLIARCKSHLDGIAEVLGVNDKLFDAPTVAWADKSGLGKLIVELR